MIADPTMYLTRLTLFLLLLFGSACSRTTAEADAPEGAFTYIEYAQVLETYVNDAGFVDYQELLRDRSGLDQYVARAAALDSEGFKKWSRGEQMAFWINTYNALTLKAIVDHYPVDSIRDVGNVIQSVWDKLKFTVMGRTITLTEIEHSILRVEFSEPRIHMAINCASIGCPPLLNEPFVAADLEEQFKQITTAFLSDSSKFRIDKKKNRVHLSPIFKWFGEDFVLKYASVKKRAKLDKKENAVLNFLMAYANEADAAFLRGDGFKLKWLDYDWGLNQQ
jgi:hypothetical protein